MGAMGKPSLSIRVAFLLSLSLASATTTAAATTTTTTSPSFPFLKRPVKVKLHSSSSSSSPSPNGPVPKATASDLLALLGPAQQSSSINAQEAQQLWSCFKFLVPFSPNSSQLVITQPLTRRSLSLNSLSSKRIKNIKRSKEEENELIWWPPAPVMELARLAVDSGADPGSIHRALDPTPINVPDCEGSNEERCELTRTPYGRRFINEELNSYLEFLFELILERGPSVGLDVSLSRYDLFHGHVFIARDSGRLGILFHAKEYPAYDKEVFPCYMGYCQAGSNVRYDDSMNLRNILWLAPLPSNSTQEWLAPGVLVVLDAHPGGIIYRDLIPKYVQIARTLYEEYFGEVVVDVNYLNVGGQVSKYEIFIC